MAPEADARGTFYEYAYPKPLREAERALLEQRGQATGPLTGLAISGGGIRSATFALGVLQAIARAGKLSRIHFMSTVSGGGYAGSFLGRLFHRDYVRNVADVESILTGPPLVSTPPPTGDPRAAARASAGKQVVAWLRENGRYLSPRGAGDLLLAGGVLFRNWIAVHAVLGVFLLAAFLLLQAPRLLEPYVREWDAAREMAGAVAAALRNDWIYWSPWVLLVPVAILIALPFAWAYWLVAADADAPGARRRSLEPGALFAIITLIAAAVAIASWWRGNDAPGILVTRLVASVVGIEAAASLVVFRLARRVAILRMARETRREATQASDPRLFRDQKMRNWLSVWWTRMLLVITIIAGIALIDSIGQTVYTAGFARVRTWVAAIVAGFAALSGVGRQLVVLLGPRAERRVPLPVSAVAAVIAFLIAGIMLVAFNTLAHAVLWQFGTPGEAALRQPYPYAAWLIVLSLVAWFVGGAFSFLNESTHLRLYAARLTRAYLGASNAARWMNGYQPVVEAIPGDDVDTWKYWDPSGGSGIKAGMPLHIVNVTINETLGGKSQTEQQDRKGLSLAIGPAGLSSSVCHHAVLSRAGGTQAADTRATIAAVTPASGYRIFNYEAGREAPFEELSLGRWVGISGAAFSTGTGFRTSLGLSLLTGLMNVRLGYWWNSGVTLPREDAVTTRAYFGRLGRLFPVQSYLLSEMTGRFPGVAYRHWYISDGGHFENMGGYELIRRRLPFIVVIDAEADPDYRFEGMSGLVRKARLDFQTEITFLSDSAIDRMSESLAAAHPDRAAAIRHARLLFGALETLRPASDPKQPPRTARFGMALVEYPNDGAPALAGGPPATGVLLYVKPTLRGTEPADVVEYASGHAPFPQQTTADQFFDEAQWESYRRLGDFLGSKAMAVLALAEQMPAVDLTRAAHDALHGG